MHNPLSAARGAPGALLGGRYRLVRPIGEGAMGSVWAAADERSGREVAVKLIARPEPELRLRLVREARACSLLKHPNIIDVFEIVEAGDGDPFLVMELLTGETVGELLDRRRRVDAGLAARIGRDVAIALAAAHAVSIIHRDLKPANIFLHRRSGAEDFVVKVLDFGISKNLSSSDGMRTAVGSAVGSPFYMSPEQVRGAADIDHRADLWALGVVVFEMLTGVRPFPGETHEVYARVLTDEIPSVDRYVRRIDPGLVQVVARCLQRDRGARVGSAMELAGLLAPFAGGAAPAPAPSWGGVPARTHPSDVGAPLPPVDAALLMHDDDMPTAIFDPGAIRVAVGAPPGQAPPSVPQAPATGPWPQRAPLPSASSWTEGGTFRMTAEQALSFQATQPPAAHTAGGAPAQPSGAHLAPPGVAVPAGGAGSSMTALVRGPEGGPASSGGTLLAPPAAPQSSLRGQSALIGLLVGLVLALCVIGVSLVMVLSGPSAPAPAAATSAPPLPDASASPPPEPLPPASASSAPESPPEPPSSASALTAPESPPSAPAVAASASPPPASPPLPASTRPPPPSTPAPRPPPVKRDCSKLKLLERQRCERGQ